MRGICWREATSGKTWNNSTNKTVIELLRQEIAGEAGTWGLFILKENHFEPHEDGPKMFPRVQGEQNAITGEWEPFGLRSWVPLWHWWDLELCLSPERWWPCWPPHSVAGGTGTVWIACARRLCGLWWLLPQSQMTAGNMAVKAHLEWAFVSS